MGAVKTRDSRTERALLGSCISADGPGQQAGRSDQQGGVSVAPMKLGVDRTVSCEGREFEELAVGFLGAGRSMRFRARGSSMYPLVRDGDILDVRPIGDGGVGVDDIVLYRSSRNGIIVHRVVGVGERAERATLLVKGDSVGKTDPEVEGRQVLGRVVGIERRGRRISPFPFLWRYRSSLALRLLPLRRPAYAALYGALRGLSSLFVSGNSRS
jgi:hypothetical protein